jgi:predicted AAA+ superfamily ATPase
MSRRPSPLQQHPLYGQLPLELSENIRRLNPWWGGTPGPRQPSFRRWPFPRLLHLLSKGLAPSTVLRGPRRVGKTVLLRQVMDELLSNGVSPVRILYVEFDELPTLERIAEPILAIARWYEDQILRTTINESDLRSQTVYLFFDEVQNLKAWAPQYF